MLTARGEGADVGQFKILRDSVYGGLPTGEIACLPRHTYTGIARFVHLDKHVVGNLRGVSNWMNKLLNARAVNQKST